MFIVLFALIYIDQRYKVDIGRAVDRWICRGVDGIEQLRIDQRLEFLQAVYSRRRLVSGFVNNLPAIALIVAFIFALPSVMLISLQMPRWTGMAPPVYEASVQRRWLRQAVASPTCVRCGYDLRGVPREGPIARCPECATINWTGLTGGHQKYTPAVTQPVEIARGWMSGQDEGPSMRIPYSKPYRAFPELDPFSDGQCQAMIAMVERRPSTQSEGCLAGCGAVCAALVCIIAFVRLVIMPLSSTLSGVWRRSDVLSSVPLVLTITLIVGVPALSMLMVRDMRLRRSIRRVLEHGAICTQCRYSLLGLPEVTDGRVRCPECGHLNVSDPALRALVTPGVISE